MTVELLYLPGCPHHAAALDLARDVLKEAGMAAELIEVPISDHNEALERRFPGSPTLRVNGQDIEDVAPERLAIGFACRTYLVDGISGGVPPRAWLERAIRSAQATEERRS